ncbi:MAG: hypothetical protein WC565_04855 [Parcubacteria group bacterium]
MAMIVGAISIDPVSGTTIAATGAAGAAFNSLIAKADFGTLSTTNPPAYAKAKQQIADVAEAIATATAYLLSDGQLQGTVASGIAVSTAGTATAQTGATTAPGTVTGKVI